MLVMGLVNQEQNYLHSFNAIFTSCLSPSATPVEGIIIIIMSSAMILSDHSMAIITAVCESMWRNDNHMNSCHMDSSVSSLWTKMGPLIHPTFEVAIQWMKGSPLSLSKECESCTWDAWQCKESRSEYYGRYPSLQAMGETGTYHIFTFTWHESIWLQSLCQMKKPFWGHHFITWAITMIDLQVRQKKNTMKESKYFIS